MTTRAIKACPRCWKSFDRQDWLALPIAETNDAESSQELRSCSCGMVLTIERSWLVEPMAGTIAEDPTEIHEIEPGVFLLLWPIAPGLWEGRKVSWSALQAAATDAPETV